MKSAVVSFLLEGLWLGLLICAFLQVGFFLCLLYKLNWKKVTHEVILVFDKKIKRKRHISISWKEEWSGLTKRHLLMSLFLGSEKNWAERCCDSEVSL